MARSTPLGSYQVAESERRLPARRAVRFAGRRDGSSARTERMIAGNGGQPGSHRCDTARPICSICRSAGRRNGPSILTDWMLASYGGQPGTHWSEHRLSSGELPHDGTFARSVLANNINHPKEKVSRCVE